MSIGMDDGQVREYFANNFGSAHRRAEEALAAPAIAKNLP